MRPDRSRLRRRDITALLAVIFALALGGASAQAATGGASPEYGGASASGEAIAFGALRTAGASWYGPGLYGHRTACGVVLRSDTIGVANRDLPCGTTVKFLYHGRALVTQVIDRGPYARGRDWDLTNGARLALGFPGVGRVHYAVALSYARR
jgi:rare lipoprotein A (peptidoglycan hydrolase)